HRAPSAASSGHACRGSARFLEQGRARRMRQPRHVRMRADGSRRVDRKSRGVDETILVSLEAFGWVIAFTRCPAVVDGLETILHGWDIRRLSSSTQRTPDAHVTRTPKGYRWRSSTMPR